MHPRGPLIDLWANHLAVAIAQAGQRNNPTARDKDSIGRPTLHRPDDPDQQDRADEPGNQVADPTPKVDPWSLVTPRRPTATR